MILLAILLLIGLMLVGFVILTVSAGGAIFILIFADVIVCILVIAWIIKKIIQKRRNR